MSIRATVEYQQMNVDLAILLFLTHLDQAMPMKQLISAVTGDDGFANNKGEQFRFTLKEIR